MKKKNNNVTYNQILRETKLIKNNYCSNCAYFKDEKCELNKIYKECFKLNLRVKKSLDI